MYITLLEVSFIFYYSKKSCANVGLEILFSCKQITECKFYCANSKIVILTYLYIHERSYCGKNGEIFIS